MAKNIVLLLAFFVTGLSLSAQQKYGHINSDDILQAMPEYAQLKASLERKKQEKENQLAAMYKDYQKRQEELMTLGAGLMHAIAEEKAMELDSLQQAITAFEGGIEESLIKYQLKLLDPLNDKYMKSVKAVAKEYGYTYIFDISKGNVVYYPEDNGDITPLVKKKMGIN